MSNFLTKIFSPSGRGKVWWIFILVILLTIGASIIDVGKYYNQGLDKLGWANLKVKETPFRLGLDLLGGAHLVYEANVDDIAPADRDAAIEGARDVIERRVNIFGVSEPLVQTNETVNGDYRLIVELAGITDINKAIQMIGETPLLEFKEVNKEQRELTAEEKKQLEDFNKQAEEKATEVLGKALSGGDFSALAKEFSEDENSREQGGDLDWLEEKDNPAIVEIAKKLNKGQITPELTLGEAGYEIIKLEDKRNKTSAFSNQEEKEVKAAHILICYDGIENCTSGLSKEEALAKMQELKNEATPANFAELAEKNSTGPSASQGGNLGWFGRGVMVEDFEKAVFDQKVGTISDVVETQFGYHIVYKQEERTIVEYNIKRILIRTMSETDILGEESEWKNTELTGKHLEKARVEFSPQDNQPQVALEFDNEGSELFAQITERNVGQLVAIFLDGYPISIPTVNEKISGGRAFISGNFNIKEAKLLAQRLNAGALPVPIRLVSQQTVGASLGQASVKASLEAAIIGLILLGLFMIVLYRLPGLLAVISLLIYGLLVLAIFKLWPVTLTLAGLAGFTLSLGMAVDANILIFERFKEELKAGKPLNLAIEEGFKRAWSSIRDGNISTLITSFILIQFSTSVVKGFAITLSLGIVVSMFSAMIITKNLMLLVFSLRAAGNRWLLGIKNR
ncbi:protein translocase subunit SecD [Patescibacteria group bacterium]|nr:protein translocase subunit SecD [Patescibacteria group bacterium]